ncbi:hypothetical protein FKM82_031289 [Ascaphus truei]
MLIVFFKFCNDTFQQLLKYPHLPIGAKLNYGTIQLSKYGSSSVLASVVGSTIRKFEQINAHHKSYRQRCY